MYYYETLKLNEKIKINESMIYHSKNKGILIR